MRMMAKKQGLRGFVLAVVVLAGARSGWAQSGSEVKDDLFVGTEKFAQGASGVTEINMGPESLGMVGGHDSAKAKRTVLSIVRTYSYDKPGMYRMEDVEEYRRKLSTGDWHCSVHVREMKSGESTDVCERHRTDDLRESAIITVEPKSLTFIHTIRRRGEGEQSELGDVGLMGAMPGLPQLAMLGPEMAVVQARLNAMPPVDMAQVQAQVSAAMASLPRLDNAQMQANMAAARQALAEASKAMNRAKQQTQQLQHEHTHHYDYDYDSDQSTKNGATPQK